MGRICAAPPLLAAGGAGPVGREGRTALVVGADVDGAAVAADDLADDVEAEAEARRALFLAEGFEDAGEQVGGDGGAAVVDLDQHAGALAAGADPDAALAVEDGVADQVGQGLVHALAVPHPE